MLFKTIVTRYFLLQGFCTALGLKMPAMMCTEANRRPDAPGKQMAPQGMRNELFMRAAVDFGFSLEPFHQPLEMFGKRYMNVLMADLSIGAKRWRALCRLC